MCLSDWSSDVCSSDLIAQTACLNSRKRAVAIVVVEIIVRVISRIQIEKSVIVVVPPDRTAVSRIGRDAAARSEERRRERVEISVVRVTSTKREKEENG